MAEIDIKANVCCAKYNPESMYEIAVGAADHTVLTYDLRKSDKAVHTFKGALHLQPCVQPLPTTAACLTAQSCHSGTCFLVVNEHKHGCAAPYYHACFAWVSSAQAVLCPLMPRV